MEWNFKAHNIDIDSTWQILNRNKKHLQFLKQHKISSFIRYIKIKRETERDNIELKKIEEKEEKNERNHLN